ncbi:MAG: hypothetical protein ACR2RE_27395 [Geminicoccaceae bacterium]
MLSSSVVVVRQGNKYGPEYPEILRKQVAANTTAPTRFTVLGDGFDADVTLASGWPGWWSKIELFAPWNADLRPCLFVDLDTFILGNIDDLVAFRPERLTMLRDFNAPERGQSAIMAIPLDTEEVWNKFAANPDRSMKDYPGGDQAFLNAATRLDFLQDRFEGIYSYKVHRLQDAPRGRICCWHGKPKPHECGGWVKEIWDARP